MDVWGSGDTSDVKRILLGGSYAGVVAAGAVASAQLWLHAFNVDERSATRELAVPSTHVRSVPVLVSPARPHAVKKPAAPLPTGVFPESTTNAWNSRSHAPPGGLPLRHRATNGYGFGTVSTVLGVDTSRSMRTPAAIAPMVMSAES